MALAGTAQATRYFYALGVNLKSVASTIIVPAVSGKKFVPRTLWCDIVTRTGSGSVPTIKMGNGGTWDLRAAAALGDASHVALSTIDLAFDGTTRKFVFDVGTTGISIAVTVASTYTTHTADFWIEGTYK